MASNREAIVRLQAQIAATARLARRLLGDDDQFLTIVVTGVLPTEAIACYQEAEDLGVALRALNSPVDIDAVFRSECGPRRWSLLAAAVRGGRR